MLAGKGIIADVKPAASAAEPESEDNPNEENEA